MKNIHYTIIACATLLLLAGCGAKEPSQTIQFDHYQMTRYTEGKVYKTTTPTTDTTIRYQAEEITTGIANSFIVEKLPFSGDISTLAQSNLEQSQKKLMNYKGDKLTMILLTCGTNPLTGYVLNFSYDLDQGHHFFVTQYVFTQDTSVYALSFHSISSKDAAAMKKSIKTIACK